LQQHLALRGSPDFEQIGADRLGDILERGRAEIAHLEFKSSPDLPVSVLGETDRARLGDALQPRGDIDAVAHEIAVALLDDVADMDSDSELDATVLGHAGVALNEACLHLDGAAHCVHDAAELYDATIAGALDYAAMMGGDCRVEEIAA
jgi:hypothetical protein